MIFAGWIIFSFLAGFVGSDRECGFGKAFILSLILSPLVGLIYAFSSTKNSTIEFQKKLLASSSAKLEAKQQLSPAELRQEEIVADMMDLQRLKDKGIITDFEFDEKKQKLMDDPCWQEIDAEARKKRMSIKPTVFNKPLY